MLNTNAQTIRSKIALGESTSNVGTLFINNAKDYAERPAFAERVNGEYKHWSWEQLMLDIYKISNHLLSLGLSTDGSSVDGMNTARVAFIAGNNYQRLVCEMAVMSCGLVSVPIFAGYPNEQMSRLLKFSQVDLLITDLPEKVATLEPDILPGKILVLNDTKLYGMERSNHCFTFEQIIKDELSYDKIAEVKNIFIEVDPSKLALIMYTSGTSGFPKGVQLSHKNLMSQQKALTLLWDPEPGMRFLCYLPWHHSFGGLFERFFALHSGGCLAIDDSCGKDVDQLIKNFSEIKPHVYFSVPKIYQEIVSRVLTSKQVESDFFHHR